MRISRREFVKSVTASGIALSVSRLAIAQEPSFAARETLPGRQAWNPAATGVGRIDGVAKVTGAKLYASDFRAADLPGWPQNTAHAMFILAPDATHVYTGMDLSRLSGALKPAVVVTAADLARIGTRVPEFYAGDLFCPVGTTPLYLGQPVALLIFEQFDAFDQVRLALRDGTFVKFGEETGPIRAPDYGAYRFTRVAGPTPDAPDVYSTFKDGLVSPEHFQNTELPVWAPLAMPKAQPYPKAAIYGEQIRAELAASNPALLVLDREFENPSNDCMFLEPECGIAWYDAGRKNLELVLGVQSPFENAEAIVFLLGEASAAFKPTRINAHRLCRWRIRRTRPYPVPVVGCAGGDILPGSSGPACLQPLSAVPDGHQAARIQNSHADRGRSRERQDCRIRRRPHIGWRRPRQFLGHSCEGWRPDGDRRL